MGQALFWAFLKNYCLRPSCYQCNFKTINREADITLADFWGSDNFNIYLDKEQGISLVIVHSVKGMELLKNVLGDVDVEEVDIKKGIEYNSAMVHSAYEPSNRADFMRDIQEQNFGAVINKYCEGSILKKIKKRLFRVFHKGVS